MTRKIVLAGMRSSGLGPWIRVTGREVGVRITHLLPGETIVLHTNPDDNPRVFEGDGPHPFSIEKHTRYMFEKVTDRDISPTIVEVEFK